MRSNRERLPKSHAINSALDGEAITRSKARKPSKELERVHPIGTDDMRLVRPVGPPLDAVKRLPDTALKREAKPVNLWQVLAETEIDVNRRRKQHDVASLLTQTPRQVSANIDTPRPKDERMHVERTEDNHPQSAPETAE